MKKLLVIAALMAAGCSADVSATTPETKPAPTSEAATKESPVKPKTSAATYEMKITGMMCAHCQATVTKLITGVKGVENAAVDFKTGKATVTIKPGATVTADSLREAVEKDYEVQSVEAVTN
jgi:P-type Cu2+ transporter